MTSYKKRNYKSKKGKKGRKTRKMQMKEVYLRKKGGRMDYINIGKGNPWRLDPTLKQLIECEQYIIFIDNPGEKNDYTYGVEPGVGKDVMNKKLFLNIIDSLSRDDDKKSVHKHFGMHRIFMILKDDTGYCCSKDSKRSEGKEVSNRSEEKGYNKDNRGEKKGYKGGSEEKLQNDGKEYVAEAKGSENPETEEAEGVEGGGDNEKCNVAYFKCYDDEPIAQWIKELHACEEVDFTKTLYNATYGNSEQKLIDTRLSEINSLNKIMYLKTVYYR